eukprot:6321894-Amphidinium_carterae.2
MNHDDDDDDDDDDDALQTPPVVPLHLSQRYCRCEDMSTCTCAAFPVPVRTSGCHHCDLPQ